MVTEKEKIISGLESQKRKIQNKILAHDSGGQASREPISCWEENLKEIDACIVNRQQQVEELSHMILEIREREQRMIAA